MSYVSGYSLPLKGGYRLPHTMYKSTQSWKQRVQQTLQSLSWCVMCSVLFCVYFLPINPTDCKKDGIIPQCFCFSVTFLSNLYFTLLLFSFPPFPSSPFTMNKSWFNFTRSLDRAQLQFLVRHIFTTYSTFCWNFENYRLHMCEDMAFLMNKTRLKFTRSLG